MTPEFFNSFFHGYSTFGYIFFFGISNFHHSFMLFKFTYNLATCWGTDVYVSYYGHI